MVFKSVGTPFGETFGAGFVNNPKGAAMQMMPGTVRNYAQQGRTAVIGVAGGAIGGYLSGNGAIKGASDSAKFELQSMKNKQRRKGLPGVQSLAIAAEAGKQDALKRARKDANIQEVTKEVAADTDAGFSARAGQKLYDLIPAEILNPKPGEPDYDPDQPIINRPKAPELKTAETAKTSRNLSQLAKIELELGKLKNSEQAVKARDNISNEIMENDDIHSIAADQQRLRELRQPSANDNSNRYVSPLEENMKTKTSKRIEKLEKERNSLQQSLIQREIKAYSYSSDKQQMKEELSRLVDKANETIDRINRGTN